MGLIRRIYNHRPDRYTVARIGHLARFGMPSYQPVDLRPGFPAVFDQGQLGSCGPNAMVGAMMFDSGAACPMLSRLFLYWNTRNIEGDTADDTGVANEDLVKAAQTFGVCPESEWPYDAVQFSVQPPPETYADGKANSLLLAVPLQQDLNTIMMTLAARIPIVAGISVYESFEGDDVAASGVIPVPDTGSEQLLGRHDIVICGADPTNDFAWLRNSWGPSWGIGGYAKLPLTKYFLDPNLADSLWAIRSVGVSQ